VQLAGFDQRGEHCPVFRALVAAGEEGIFSGKGDRARGAFDDVGVDFDAAIVEEVRIERTRCCGSGVIV
jgi:hypothetical protein